MPYAKKESLIAWRKKQDPEKVRAYHAAYRERYRERRLLAYRKKRGDAFREFNRIWNPTIWDEGYTSNGRFRVKMPDHPNADHVGYVQRSHAVWYLMTGEVVPKGYVLHHINEDSLDDRFENLQLLTLSGHTFLHHFGKKRKERAA